MRQALSIRSPATLQRLYEQTSVLVRYAGLLFHCYHPRMSNASGSVLPEHFARPSEVQLVIARELGLPSWPRLKAHIEALDQSWANVIAPSYGPGAGVGRKAVAEKLRRAEAGLQSAASRYERIVRWFEK